MIATFSFFMSKNKRGDHFRTKNGIKSSVKFCGTPIYVESEQTPIKREQPSLRPSSTHFEYKYAKIENHDAYFDSKFTD
jgi:hypothetical protein